MTTPKITFRIIQLEERPQLDSDRVDLFSLWFRAMIHNPALACDERWLRIGTAIVSGASLMEWVSDSEMEPWNLPERTPGVFLDELDALVEDEEGADLQHLSWDDGEFGE